LFPRYIHRQNNPHTNMISMRGGIETEATKPLKIVQKIKNAHPAITL
jgi:hypothetical protein